MIILDTNVISEVLKPRPSADVCEWLDSQPEISLWTTSVTVFELWYGVRLLEQGRRRSALEAGLRAFLGEDLEGRILPFDATAAEDAGALAAQLKARGEVQDFRDLQIAAIARARGAIVATRNTRHFEMMCRWVDPWPS